MSINDQIQNDYFNWLYDFMCKNKYHKDISYRKLFSFLHNKEFTFLIARDGNRASDGVDLRYRFSTDHRVLYALDGPCSVLEMMIALAIRCEESIMTDTQYGDRTKQWFWIMIKNLGLSTMTDDNFDMQIVEDRIDKFLKRQYSYNGKGNIFYIPNTKNDLRNAEIWAQLCWFLSGM